MNEDLAQEMKLKYQHNIEKLLVRFQEVSDLHVVNVGFTAFRNTEGGKVSHPIVNLVVESFEQREDKYRERILNPKPRYGGI